MVVGAISARHSGSGSGSDTSDSSFTPRGPLPSAVAADLAALTSEKDDTCRPPPAFSSSFSATISENNHGGIRSHYFLPGDIVWVRPARLPYWPAEVIEISEPLNVVKAKLLDPPPVPLLKANEKLELQQQKKIQEKQRRLTTKRKRGESILVDCGSSRTESGTQREGVMEEVEAENLVRKSETSEGAPPGDVVTTSGIRVYFFDKLLTPEDVESCVEERLKRGSYDVRMYEGFFYKAVLHANRLVRITLRPELLQPYQVCGVGVVHSLMRTHTSAPRQPHTGKAAPQPGVIRLRKGFENAARDLLGFEYIWVLFQFSYAAAIATCVGQQYVLQTKEEEEKQKKRVEGEITKPIHEVEVEGCNFGKVSHSTSTDSQYDTTVGNPNRAFTSSSSQSGGSPPFIPQSSSASPSSTLLVSDTAIPTTSSAGQEMCGNPLRNWRHRQGLSNSVGFKTMIIPPRDNELRGVFATRSPHRPNFIGLSAVRLVSVQGLDIHIMDHDLLHGTPVLDIKPYLPFCDAYPNAKAGWVEELDARGTAKADHKYETQEMFVHRVFESTEDVNKSAEKKD